MIDLMLVNVRSGDVDREGIDGQVIRNLAGRRDTLPFRCLIEIKRPSQDAVRIIHQKHRVLLETIEILLCVILLVDRTTNDNILIILNIL